MTASDDSERTGTLAAYDTHASQYVDRTSHEPSPLVAELSALTAAGSTVLELGSGPGTDAFAMEQLGLVVHRTDGAAAFVRRFTEAGIDARVLDFYADDFGGPYDAIFANAVLLHVKRERLAGVLSVALAATRPGGVLAATFKKGAGEEWSTQKLDAPRHFTYWREDDLAREVETSGWKVDRIVESTTAESPVRWITVIALAP